MAVYIFDRSSKERKDQQFFNHATNNTISKNELITEFKGLSAEQILSRISKRPVCPKCESFMYRHWEKGDPNHKQGVCPNCGYRGASITVQEYWDAKLHR